MPATMPCVDRIGAQRRPDRALFQVHRRPPAASRSAGTAPDRRPPASLPRLVMRPGSSILALDGGHADDLVVQHDRQPVADIAPRCSGRSACRRPGESVKLVSHLRNSSWPGRALRRSRPVITGVRATRYHCSPSSPPRGSDPHQLRVQRQHAAVLRQRRFAGSGTDRPSLRTISSTAAVPMISLTRAGSSTPGSCTRIS